MNLKECIKNFLLEELASTIAAAGGDPEEYKRIKQGKEDKQGGSYVKKGRTLAQRLSQMKRNRNAGVSKRTTGTEKYRGEGERTPPMTKHQIDTTGPADQKSISSKVQANNDALNTLFTKLGGPSRKFRIKRIKPKG